MGMIHISDERKISGRYLGRRRRTSQNKAWRQVPEGQRAGLSVLPLLLLLPGDPYASTGSTGSIWEQATRSVLYREAGGLFGISRLNSY
jgi:hypothetical protein